MTGGRGRTVPEVPDSRRSRRCLGSNEAELSHAAMLGQDERISLYALRVLGPSLVTPHFQSKLRYETQVHRLKTRYCTHKPSA